MREPTEGELDDLEFEYEFKKAVIKLKEDLPEILRTINDHTKAMDELSQSIKLMPHSLKEK